MVKEAELQKPRKRLRNPTCTFASTLSGNVNVMLTGHICNAWCCNLQVQIKNTFSSDPPDFYIFVLRYLSFIWSVHSSWTFPVLADYFHLTSQTILPSENSLSQSLSLVHHWDTASELQGNCRHVISLPSMCGDAVNTVITPKCLTTVLPKVVPPTQDLKLRAVTLLK